MTTTNPTTTVLMPALGENVTEGTVTRWLKQPGEAVTFEEPLLEVATDKVDTEVPSPVAGVLTEIIASEDDIIEIGAPLAVITPTDATRIPNGGMPSASTRKDGAALPPSTPFAAPERMFTAYSGTPSAPAGEQSTAEPQPDTTRPDTTEAFTDPVPTPVTAPIRESAPLDAEADRVEKLPRIRRTIAARMVESLQTAAQLTTVLEVDISAIARLRRENADSFLNRTGHKLSYLPFFVKAAVEALNDNPVVNASLDVDVTTVTYYRACHLGIAVDSDRGLMVPVIRDAQNRSISDLAQSIANAAYRVRTNKIGADELSGGTFTITNTGSRGALFDTPIINQPQSAILGTGTVVERLAPVHDSSGNLTISVVPTVYLSLSYDHRIVDGADAARYLGAVKHRLEQGYTQADLF